MPVFVYKSLRKPDTYLYVPARDAFDAVPEAVQAPLKPWQFVLEFELTPGRRLARVDAAVGQQIVAGASLGVAGPARPVIGFELRRDGPRLSPIDLHRRMESIRETASAGGLGVLEGLARRSAQLALLPGHRIAMQCCLEHAEDAIHGFGPDDDSKILAALALRIG